MSLNTMRDLLLEELRAVYSAEKQLVKALAWMAESASSSELKDALEAHREETRGQVDRLEQAFEVLGKKPKSRKGRGMRGLIDEAEASCDAKGEDAVRDAGIIAAAQRIEHYEMAAYGCLVAFAKTVGEAQVVELLEATLREEEATDEALSLLAERAVNPAASSAGNADEAKGIRKEKKGKKGSGEKQQDDALEERLGFTSDSVPDSMPVRVGAGNRDRDDE